MWVQSLPYYTHPPGLLEKTSQNGTDREVHRLQGESRKPTDSVVVTLDVLRGRGGSPGSRLVTRKECSMWGCGLEE